MWVSLIPLGGVTAIWSDWKQGDSGMKLPTSHTISGFGMELDLGDVKKRTIPKRMP